ncbi:MAG: methyltransferase [Deltaproteobacteria bacterium]|nr:methyltransferase [Deltaproteobacteria bacterium]
MKKDEKQLTKDTLFDGDIVCFQHKNGYRFSIDAVLLSHFVSVRNGDRFLDLGTGCGVVNLIINYRHKELLREISGVEVQTELHRLAKKNYDHNSMLDCGEVFHLNIKEISEYFNPESYEKITCNPPFYMPGSGRESQNQEAKFARHQVLGELSDFMRASFYALINRGTAYFIYPAELTTTFISVAKQFRMEVKKIRFVYSYPCSGKPAKIALFECVKNGRSGVEIMDSLYVYSQKKGDYSNETKNYYRSNSWLHSPLQNEK